MRSSSSIGLLLAALAVAGASVPRDAHACGGTFCDTGPRAMPVDQTGENILFVMQPGTVEAHIQIQYKGEPDKFSWILPVQALPEFEVGSQALFDLLLARTVPSYGLSQQPDFCGSNSSAFTGSTGPGTSGTTGGGSGTGPGGPPVVVFTKPIGAFEVTVLMGQQTADVVKWLTDNQYQLPDMAPKLFDLYVAKHYFFVAVKLRGGKGIADIHPLVVRFPGTEPCVPIMLTAVAAVDDMGIRTFFLGNKQVVPKNYKHVVPNQVRLDWFNIQTAYPNYVGRAVDSPIANGQAFVTEYAGPTGIVGATPLAQRSWNAAPFQNSAAVGVVQLLTNQGLMSCLGNTCTYTHPLILPLLRQYLPAPATLTTQNGTVLTDPTIIEGYFYSCEACYQSQIDSSRWSGPMFAADLASRVIDPAKHADAILGAWPYLTRMFTTISPAEMTADPEFFERDGLPNVTTLVNTGVERTTCDGKAGVTFPNGRTLGLISSTGWPLLPSTMPWAERIEEFPANGGPAIVLVDNNAIIDAELKKWNSAQGWPPATTVGGGPGGVTSVGTTGDATSAGTGGAGGGGADPGAPVDNRSCSCRTVGGATNTAAAPAALLGLAAAWAGRRRRKHG